VDDNPAKKHKNPVPKNPSAGNMSHLATISLSVKILFPQSTLLKVEKEGKIGLPH
jgi:hypothetical protein